MIQVETTMKMRTFLTIPGLAALILLTSAVHASALIRITPEGVAVPNQTVTDPVPISADGFRLTYHGGGSDTIVDPLVLIFATAGGSSAPGLTASGPSSPSSLTVDITLGGANVFGGSWNTATGYAGVYDAAAYNNTNSVYDVIGFDPAGSSSQNYSNWNGVSGITSWDLWVYTLDFGPDPLDMAQGDWIEFSTTNLSMDSFVVGYGCSTLNTTMDACKNSGSTESTPFTFAGYVTTTDGDPSGVPIPEPSILALMSAGLIGLIGFARRK
jgi:hypothetical protein